MPKLVHRVVDEMPIEWACLPTYCTVVILHLKVRANGEPMSWTNFRVTYQSYAGIMQQSDWLKLVMWLSTANHSASFLCSIAILKMLLTRLLSHKSSKSGYGRRLMFKRLWVRIPVLYTGWTWHFFTLICCKNCLVCLKILEINEKEAEVGPFF